MRPKSYGIVDDRREEIGGRDQRLRVVQAVDRRVVGGLGADQQVLRQKPLIGVVARISDSTAGAILQPQPPPWLNSVSRMRSGAFISVEFYLWGISRSSTRSSTCARPQSTPKTTSPARFLRRCSTTPSARRSARSTSRSRRSTPRSSARRCSRRTSRTTSRRCSRARTDGLEAAGLLLARRQALGRRGAHPARDRLGRGDARGRLQGLPALGGAAARRYCPRASSSASSTAPPAAARAACSRALARAGAQVLDLEDLAAHRGSVLGNLPERPQPSQKMFESLLLDKALRLWSPQSRCTSKANRRRSASSRCPRR